MLPSTAQVQTRRSALHDAKRLPSSAAIVRDPGMYDQRFGLAIAHLTGSLVALPAAYKAREQGVRQQPSPPTKPLCSHYRLSGLSALIKLNPPVSMLANIFVPVLALASTGLAYPAHVETRTVQKRDAIPGYETWYDRGFCLVRGSDRFRVSELC